MSSRVSQSGAGDAVSLRSRVRSFLSVPKGNPELLKAQYRAFSRQLPMMYVILMVSTWALAATHMHLAPPWLTVGVPMLMTVVSVIRIARWSKSRHLDPSPGLAAQALTRTNRLALILAVGFSAWAFMLFPYGGTSENAHVAFYMAITGMGCIFCLVHLRPAALIVALIVNAGFIGFFSVAGQPTLMAISVNFVLVSVAMLTILLVNYRDFTRMVDAQVRTQALSDENLRLANVDSLTDLPNRRAFFDRLQDVIDLSKARESGFALGLLDLDGFKPVNDLHGHATGDKLLAEVARRLGALCSPQDVHLSRLGGDEFALIVTHMTDRASLLSFGEELCLALSAPFRLPEAAVHISGSIGFAVYPEMASSSAELFERADYALYHGKRCKRGTATLFSSEHEAAIHRDSRIEQALKMADFDEELSVVFQPIVDSKGRRTIGFEALARWSSPVLGRVSPAAFIPVAERAGMIGKLTRSLLRKALAAATLWPDDVRLSFNLSAFDLSAPENILSVVGLIEKSGFDPRRLDLEITETALSQDFEHIQRSIETLRLLGCGISLDDFGTGYSSLSRLHALPLTKIKIDRSFIAGLHENTVGYKIVKSLLALSRDMELECIVEGVETEEELSALERLGGVMFQGYFYSPPIGPDEVAHFITSFRKPVAAAGLSI